MHTHFQRKDELCCWNKKKYDHCKHLIGINSMQHAHGTVASKMNDIFLLYNLIRICFLTKRYHTRCHCHCHWCCCCCFGCFFCQFFFKRKKRTEISVTKEKMMFSCKMYLPFIQQHVSGSNFIEIDNKNSMQHMNASTLDGGNKLKIAETKMKIEIHLNLISFFRLHLLS